MLEEISIEVGEEDDIWFKPRITVLKRNWGRFKSIAALRNKKLTQLAQVMLRDFLSRESDPVWQALDDLATSRGQARNDLAREVISAFLDTQQASN